MILSLQIIYLAQTKVRQHIKKKFNRPFKSYTFYCGLAFDVKWVRQIWTNSQMHSGKICMRAAVARCVSSPSCYNAQAMCVQWSTHLTHVIEVFTVQRTTNNGGWRHTCWPWYAAIRYADTIWIWRRALAGRSKILSVPLIVVKHTSTVAKLQLKRA
jgi:hypothetical protein